jgi:multidrug resistance efflux pump
MSEMSERIIELERERDEARRELAILKAECAKISEEFGLPPTVRPADGEIKRMINGWKEALEERDEARRELASMRKELAASNRGAEKNAKVNQGLCARLAEAERERDEARRERDEAGVKLELAEAKALIMEDSLRWIAGRYCREKTTVHLALVAYEMSSEARWTLQELEQNEEAK